MRATPPILAVNALAHGHHDGAWRANPGAQPLTSLAHYRDIARVADDGGFDLVFVADFMAFNPAVRHTPRWEMEPLTLMAALSQSTRRATLAATASTTYGTVNEVVDGLGAISELSGGRAAWNMVTSGDPAVARHFGLTAQPAAAVRYTMAASFVEAALAGWDAEGIPRPLLLQAGASEAGRAFASTYADVVFTAQADEAPAREFRADIRSRAARRGRDPDRVRVVPGLSVVLGSTRAEAMRHKSELDAWVPLESAVDWLSGFGLDLASVDPDGPLPVLEHVEGFEGISSRVEVLRDHVSRTGVATLRQLAQSLAGSRGHATVVGTPEDVADLMGDWVRHGAADGFMVMPQTLPDGLRDFVEHVVPLLREHGFARD